MNSRSNEIRPGEKRARLTAADSKDTAGNEEPLRGTAEAFWDSSFLESQHQFWIDRDKNWMAWDFILRTDDGHQIRCSKKDLAQFSESFLRMLSEANSQMASCKQLTVNNAKGRDLETLLSLHYSREKVSVCVLFLRLPSGALAYMQVLMAASLIFNNCSPKHGFAVKQVCVETKPCLKGITN